MISLALVVVHGQEMAALACGFSDTYFGQASVLGLLGLSELLHLVDTPSKTPIGLDRLLLAVEPEAILRLEACIGAGSGYGAQVVLVQSDGETVVGGEDERGVTLAPVLDHGDVDRRRAGRLVNGRRHG
jgi:hypothetical protein